MKFIKTFLFVLVAFFSINFISSQNILGVAKVEALAADCAAGTTWNEIQWKCNPPTGLLGDYQSNGTCVIQKDKSTCQVSFWAEVRDPLLGANTLLDTSPITGWNKTKIENSGQYYADISFGDTTFYLYHNNVKLYERTAYATCVSGTIWDSTNKKCITSLTPSGELVANNSGCSIYENKNSCLPPDITWKIYNFTPNGVVSVTRSDNASTTITNTGTIGSTYKYGKVVDTNVIPYGDVTYYLNYDGVQVSKMRLNAHCNNPSGAHVWNITNQRCEPVTAELKTSSASVLSGESATLSWTSNNATWCSLRSSLAGNGIVEHGLSNAGFSTGALTSNTGFSLDCQAIVSNNAGYGIAIPQSNKGTYLTISIAAPTPTIDLSVSDPIHTYNGSPTSEPIVAGGWAYFTSDITNNGNTSTGATFRHAVLTAGGSSSMPFYSQELHIDMDVDLSGVVSNAALAAGESEKSVEVGVHFPLAGINFVKTCVDTEGPEFPGYKGTTPTWPGYSVPQGTDLLSMNIITESNESNNCSAWVPVDVVAAPAVLTVATGPVTNITTTTATSSVTTGGVSANRAGIVWSTTSNPTVASNLGINTAGYAVGLKSLDMTSLTANTTYHVRAYASIDAGVTYTYGSDVSFTTSPIVAVLTVVTGSPTTDITSTSAKSTVTTGGVSANRAGIVWSTTPNPTVETNLGINTAGWASGTSPALSMTGLTANTIYHVRAYASIDAGVTYTYGSDVSFTTSPIVAVLTVVTGSPTTDITSTSAKSTVTTGGVDATGGDVGIVWSSTANPTVETNLGINTGGWGVGTSPDLSMTGLTADTTYYVKAYGRTLDSKNKGIDYTYGNQVSFTTSAPTYTGIWKDGVCPSYCEYPGGEINRSCIGDNGSCNPLLQKQTCLKTSACLSFCQLNPTDPSCVIHPDPVLKPIPQIKEI